MPHTHYLVIRVNLETVDTTGEAAVLAHTVDDESGALYLLNVYQDSYAEHNYDDGTAFILATTVVD